MFWLKRFFTDLVGGYVDGLRAARGLPWLFLALVLWEFAQHVVEVQTGFFDSKTVPRGAALDPIRMVLGWIKMISVYIGCYLVFRYLHWGSARRAFAPDWPAMMRYFPYLAYSLVAFALIFYAPSFIPRAQVMVFRNVIGLTQLLVEPLLILWIVSAATGGPVRGPLNSIWQTGWLYLWALPLTFIGRLPLNGGHTLLNYSALGQPKTIVWPMLALDAVVVGLLITIVPALYFRIARSVSEHAARGEELSAPAALAAVSA